MIVMSNADSFWMRSNRRYPLGLKLSIKGESGLSVTTDNLGQNAGCFKLSRTHASKMFYFFFESRNNRTTDPIVLWMTGGPSCASELALSCLVSGIIFVDQPIRICFSYTTNIWDLRHDEDGVSKDTYDFFQEFFKSHPEYAGNDFFVTGESYASHCIPAVVARIHKGNKAKKGMHINMKGFAIGNGLTQPDIQYETYADFALENGLIDNLDYKHPSFVVN